LDSVFYPEFPFEKVEKGKPSVVGVGFAETDCTPWELAELRLDDIIFERDLNPGVITA